MINSFIENANAANLGLNAGHISANLEKYEAARSGFFTFIVNDNNLTDSTLSLSPQAFGSTNTANYIDAQERIALSVAKCDIPHFSVEVLRMRRGNDEIKFAGVPTFGPGNLIVDDFVGLNAKNMLTAWHGLTYNVKTRKGGRMKDYKKTCTLVEYTQDFEQVRSWTVEGCWISDLSEDSFDRENDGKRQITAKFEYDRAILNENEDGSYTFVTNY